VTAPGLAHGARARAAAALACLACAPGARAAEWSFAPTVSWSADYDSNRYFLPSPAPGEGQFLSFNGLLTHSSDVLQLSLAPFLSVQRFSGNSGTDSNNGSINTSAAWSLERSTFSLSAGYSDLSTLLTELESTGVIKGNSHQEQTSGGASWALVESAKTELSVQLGYADVRYVGANTLGLSSYDYSNASIAEQYTPVERTTFTLTAFGGDVSSPGGPGTSRNAGVSLSAERKFSERLTGYISAGYSDLDYGIGTDHSAVGEARVSRVGERSQLKLDYQRSVTPNGFGTLVVRDQASFTASRDLTPHLSVLTSLVATRDRERFFVVLYEQQTYESAQATLDWHSGETSTVDLTAGYDRTTVQSILPLPSGSRWRAALTYTWSVKPHAVSR